MTTRAEPTGVAGSTGSCPARCALAGNPSDGHGGAVVATVIPAWEAAVTVMASDHFRIGATELGDRTITELDARIRSEGCGDAHPLVLATLVALHRHVDAELRPVDISVDTTIPRSVGLAGSSAIVIATIRALLVHHRGAGWADRLGADPSLIASLALTAERDVLGIAAGLQDRVVQSLGGTVAMEFGGVHRRTVGGLGAGSYRRLGSVPGEMFVAYRSETAGNSGDVHAGIDSSAPGFVSAMERAADQARRAAHAIETGDPIELGRAMDATFDLRASVMVLDPAHVEMIDVARRHGASANYTGSGGAIVVLAADRDTAVRARHRLHTDLGCRTLALT